MSTHELLKSLAESLRESVTVEKVYGEPIEAQGKTVIPVARITTGWAAATGRARSTARRAARKSGRGVRAGAGALSCLPWASSR